ncbi:MAG: alanyl-tRNA editing protein AlaXM [Candidatus Anstonellaceae archaeon]
MQEALYLEDAYLKSCTSNIMQVQEGKYVILDKTVFYPTGGGQPCDTGTLIRISDGATFKVISVSKSWGNIIHEIEPNSSVPPLEIGQQVQCNIDWERRYRLMRMHTAGHILSAILYSEKGILITGNQLGTDKSRFDFSLQNFDRAEFESLVKKANEVISCNLEVKVFFISRQEALAYPGAVKLASALPPEISTLRMVQIGDIDCQADGGTHVKNTSEIGKIIFLAAENKGKNNRRVIFTLEP